MNTASLKKRKKFFILAKHQRGELLGYEQTVKASHSVWFPFIIRFRSILLYMF